MQEAIGTFEDYVKGMIGERVGVTIASYPNDILGKLEHVTTTMEGAVDGIVVEKWGWIKREDIRRINKAQTKNSRG